MADTESKSLVKVDVAYIYCKNLIKQCDRLPTMKRRASIVQDLITSYRLLFHKRIKVIQSLEATEDELKLFHSTDFLEFMKKTNNSTDLEEFEEEQEEYGLGYDCPLLLQHYDFVKVLAGGSLTAARLLTKFKCPIAINWFGGWHHAQRSSAAGFCYVNDIVLAIQKLTETFKKILYIDLDIHHGDGVQNAFQYSPNILTLSFHKFSPGFYPGTGDLTDIGASKGKYRTINVPLLEGISDGSYTKLFDAIFPMIYSSFKPDAMVVQCGADSLQGDKLGEANLTLETIGNCVKKILACTKPILFCGGGGYNFPNTARLWTYLTAVIIGENLDNDVPDHSEFFTLYAPTYELFIDPVKVKDRNSEEYIEMVISTIKGYCSFLD